MTQLVGINNSDKHIILPGDPPASMQVIGPHDIVEALVLITSSIAIDLCDRGLATAMQGRLAPHWGQIMDAVERDAKRKQKTEAKKKATQQTP